MKTQRRRRTARASAKPPEPERLGRQAARFLATPTGRAWVAIFVLGTAVRLAFIGVPIRYDEAFTFLQYARFPVAQFIGDYSFPNNHLLHTLLVHASTRLFGPWEWAIRLPAFLAGVASLPVFYLLGRRAGDPSTGLWAMALAAGSSPLVEYSTDGRGYTMVVLCTALLLLLSLRIASGEGKRGDWILFCLAGIAGAYTIPVMIYPLAAGFLWMLAGADRDPPVERQRLIRPLVLAGAAIAAGTLLCYLPVVVESGWASLAANRFVQPKTWRAMAASVPALPVELFSYFNQYLPLPMTAIVGVAAMAGVVRFPRLAAATLITTAGLMALQRVVPLVRVFTFGLVIYFLMAAVGITWLISAFWRRTDRKPPAPWALPLAWTVAAVAAVYLARGPETSSDRFPEARPMAEFIARSYGRTADVVASPLATATMGYYGSDRGRGDFGSDLDIDHPPDVTHFVVNRRLEDPDSFRRQRKRHFLYFNPARLVLAVDSAELYEAESVLTRGIEPGALLETYVRELKATGTIGAAEFKDALLATSILYGVGAYDDALDVGTKLLREDPGNADLKRLLARIAAEREIRRPS